MTDQDLNPEGRTRAIEVRNTTDPSTLPANPKRVIRTFATDVANVTGAPAPVTAPLPKPVAAVPATPPPPPPVAAPKPSLADAVSNIHLPKAEPVVAHLPPLTKQPAPKLRTPAPKPTQAWPKPVTSSGEWERAVTKTEPSFIAKLFSFIFGTTTTVSAPKTYGPAPVPKQPVAQTPVAVEPSFKPSGAAADEAREREAVLARLRARVETYQPGNPAPPVFPTPLPESQPGTRPAYIPLPVPASAPTEPGRIHTYTSDFSNRIDTQGASAFSVYAAQADAGQSTATAVGEPKKSGLAALAYTLAGAVFLIGGSLLLYFGYTYFAGNQPVAIIPSAPATLISGDDQVSIAGNDGALMSKLADTATASTPIGTVRIVYFAASATSTEPGGALLQALQLPAPDILLRNIGRNSTVGVVHAGDQTRVFFVLAATSYERTFAGMLSWEATMGTDLAALYPEYPAPVVATPVATTTAKNGKAIAPPPPPVPVKPHFVDEVVQSHDVRALKDGQDHTILLYGYRDQSTLIIARDETAFGILLARLSATRTQ